MRAEVGGKKAFPNTIIRASAGTGKTFQLSNRYLRLLVAGAEPESILASTFTRKAAGEILDRVIQRLARGAHSAEGAFELSQDLGVENLGQDQIRHLLVYMLTRLQRLQIGTLDSYFAQLARRHCLELGLSPHWTIVDEARDVWLREEAARRILSHGRASELIHLLAKGETQRSIIQVIDDTLNSLYEIYLDAVEDAWSNLPQLSPADPGALLETIEELRSLELGKSLAKGRDANLEAFEIEDFDTFLDKGLAKALVAGAETYNRSEIPAEVALYYRRLFDHIAAVRLQEHAARLQGAKGLLDAFDEQYERLKLREHALRFSDVSRILDAGIMAEPPRFNPLISEHPVAHLLLDEFQDTSPIQWRILQPVAKCVAAQASGSLLCVGDIKQAIYGWRGGVAEILDEVKSDLKDQVATEHLIKSYRSSPVIMEAVNQVFTRIDRHPKLGDDPGLRQWQARFEEHESALVQQSGHAQVFSSSDPFAFVAERIAQDPDLYARFSCGILVRSNNDVGRMMDELTRRGVPASEESGKVITDSAAVQILLSALTWLDYPGDSTARFHVAQTPLGRSWGLQADAMPFPSSADETIAADLRAALLHDGYGVTLERWVAVLLPFVEPREQQRLSQLVDLAYLFERQATIRPYDFVQHVSYRKVSDPTSSKIRVMNIHQAKGLEFDIVYLPDLDHGMVPQTPPFVTQRPRPTERVSAVSPYLNQSLQPIMPEPLPQRVREWRSHQINESLCLFYVAMTRAARALYFVVESPKSNTGNLSQTWGGLVLAALNEGRVLSDGESGCEMGNALWFDEVKEEQKPEPTATELNPRPLRFASSHPRESRLIRSTSPSAQEGGDRVEVARVLRSGSARAMLRGSAVHAVFERIRWLPESLDSGELTACLSAFALEDEVRRRVTANIAELLQSSRAREVLGETEYRSWLQQQWPEVDGATCELAVQNEYDFATLMDDELWRGAIDRLVWVRQAGQLQAADIVDFKTDQVQDQNGTLLQERVAHYRPQLEAYRRAISKMTRLPESRISTRLWFVQSNEIVDV